MDRNMKCPTCGMDVDKQTRVTLVYGDLHPFNFAECVIDDVGYSENALVVSCPELEHKLKQSHSLGYAEGLRKAVEVFDRVITIEFATHMPENLSILMARKIKVAILAEKEPK